MPYTNKSTLIYYLSSGLSTLYSYYHLLYLGSIMVNTMHWAAVFFLAASVCGSIITRETHDSSLAKLIGNNEIIRAHKENILRGMSDDILPYEEGLLQETQRLNYFPKQERECVYLRKFMNPQGLQLNINISPVRDHGRGLQAKL